MPSKIEELLSKIDELKRELRDKESLRHDEDLTQTYKLQLWAECKQIESKIMQAETKLAVISLGKTYPK